MIRSSNIATSNFTIFPVIYVLLFVSIGYDRIRNDKVGMERNLCHNFLRMCVCFVLYGAGFDLISFGPDQSREQPADKQKRGKINQNTSAVIC
jgi:hypothetical protein